MRKELELQVGHQISFDRVVRVEIEQAAGEPASLRLELLEDQIVALRPSLAKRLFPTGIAFWRQTRSGQANGPPKYRHLPLVPDEEMVVDADIRLRIAAVNQNGTLKAVTIIVQAPDKTVVTDTITQPGK